MAATLRRPPPARPGEVNYPWMDRFTLIHFGIGVVYATFRLRLVSAVGLSIVWELIENPLKAYVPALFPHPSADSWKNSLSDTLAVTFGWLTYQAPKNLVLLA